MGERREGRGSYLTPLEASRILPGLLLWVLLGLAVPVYQETSRSNRGALVEIRPSGRASQYSGIDLPYVSPLTIHADQWERAIMPVLLDERWDPRMPLNDVRLRSQPSEYLRLLGLALGESFHQNGFGELPVH